MRLLNIIVNRQITVILRMLSSTSSQSKVNRNSIQGKKPRLSKGNSIRTNTNGKQNNFMISQKTGCFPQSTKASNKKMSQEFKINEINSPIEGETDNNLDNASLQDMIELLKEYEKVCLEKQDFSSAEEAKNKIDFLKTQQLIIRKEELENQDRQNVQRISREGEEEIKAFQEYWDEQLQELIEALKEVQGNLTEQHEKQLEQIQEKLEKQETPKVKFSSHILELRKHLSNLIKVKNYKQAELIKQKLEIKESQETQKWNEKFEIKKHHKLQAIIKKQEGELKALRIRLEGVFNQKLKERDQKFQILLKKNRKRRIQSGKMSKERLKTRTAIMNESKSMQSTMGAIGNNSTYKF